jgi:GTP-binding protein HflX
MNKQIPKAILVDIIPLETSPDQAKKRLEESENLINTFGGIAIIKIIQKRGLPNYETYIGKGKVQEIIEIAKTQDAKILVVNNLLKPRQIFKLKELFRSSTKTKREEDEIQVWDRVDLILKIFSKHAESTEAKLQIELASIKHMGPRIFGMGIELSRQAGAMGFRAGAGEANIEMMKRHLQKQELAIQKKLKHYETIHQGHRKRRRRRNFKTVSIVGYTNAGKSSLLNALTGKGVYVADQLFATLDTRVGKLFIPAKQKSSDSYIPGREILISDTIGFIQDLPPDLIQAFKSTLAETIESDLILHIIDVKDSEIHKKIKVVEAILSQLGLKDKPKMYVFNKVDLISDKDELKEQTSINPKPPTKSLLKAGKDTAKKLGWHSSKNSTQISKKLLKLKYKSFTPVFISAKEKTNLHELIKMITKKI